MPLSEASGEFSSKIKETNMVRRWDPLKLLIRWLILLSLSRLCYTSSGPDVEGEALLEFLKGLNDVNNRINWDGSLVSPCYSWSDITCRDGHVISMSLNSNGFSGTLSPSITKLKFLAILELQDNNLSGLLPDYIANLTNLQHLNLADNNFTGPIPATWGQFSSLKNLILRGNNLSGPIPDTIANISGFTTLDLSSNDLTGSIPLQLFSLPIFNFSDTHLHCGSSLENPCVSSTALPVSTKKSKLAVVISSTICGAFAILSLGAISAYIYHYMHRNKRVASDVSGEFSSKIKEINMVNRWDPLKLFTRLLILLSFSGLCYTSSDPDVEGEALLEFLKSLNDVNHQINWDSHMVSPCYSWSDITCRDGHVTSLSLASKGFSGKLSPSITKLKFLAALELQDNNLSGLLPDYIANLTNLQYLNLADNNFEGPIPATWGQISSLKYLILRGNDLSGLIPDAIANISGLTTLDLSSNDLTGSIPLQLFSVPIFNFSNTRLHCGSGFEKPCVSNSDLPASAKKSKLAVVVSFASCGAFALLSLGAIFGYRYNMHRNKNDIFVDVPGEDESKVSYGQLRRFSLRELQLATNNFSESNVIGQGGFGKVYRGVLSDHMKVAVKRLADYHNPGGEAAFQREVQLISVAVHKNLLRLIGFCTTSTERILVYPFMENLSVAYRLRDLKPDEKGLDWATRKRVAFGTACGLEYLHEHCIPKIIHRDLKAANILLDDEFEAVLGDFGLAKLVDTRLTHVTTQIRGTMGHIAPEYLSTGKSSEKTDVFGYGITLLELVTGQRAIDLSRLEEEEDVLLLDHIKKILRENRLEDIVDRNLESYDPTEVETVVKVALLCAQGSPEERPIMSEVVKLLQGVGLAEKWAEWERDQLEEATNQKFSLRDQLEEATNQEAIQLSRPR